MVDFELGNLLIAAQLFSLLADSEKVLVQHSQGCYFTLCRPDVQPGDYQVEFQYQEAILSGLGS